jgi:hypothetical protein
MTAPRLQEGRSTLHRRFRKRRLRRRDLPPEKGLKKPETTGVVTNLG